MDVRNTLSLAGGLLVLGAVGYYWGGFGASTSPLIPTNTNHLPDYQVRDIDGLQTNDEGQVERTLTANSLVHYPEPDKSIVEQPVVTLYQQGVAAWTIEAQQAISLNNNRDLQLKKQVVGRRLQGQPLRLETDALNANQVQQRLDSSVAVFISSPQGQISSLGLHADLKEGVLTFPAQVRGTYVLSPR